MPKYGNAETADRKAATFTSANNRRIKRESSKTRPSGKLHDAPLVKANPKEGALTQVVMMVTSLGLTTSRSNGNTKDSSWLATS